MLDSDAYLKKKLNPPQMEAASSLEGPVLILAGAGSGKTRAITYRFANLILKGLTAPENILAVTFTNKAAKEMQERVYQILREFEIKTFSPLWIQTFHSICVRILRDHIERLGYKRSFTIYDPSDQQSQMKKVLRALNIDHKIHPPKAFLSRISWAKTEGYSPEDLERQNKRMIDKRSREVYKKYEEEMKKANALDFDDLLLKTKILFENHPDVLEIYRQRFQYLMVDEYQDTNPIQYAVIKLLAKEHKNLCVVGDEDQSIYSWRGADISNILSFEEDFGGAKLIKLEENYRSTRNIVEAATHVIQHNTQRKDKTLFTNNEEGDPIVVREESDEYSEARFVVKSIENITKYGESDYQGIAVFYRTNAQSRVIEDQLRTSGIPYKIIGGLKFYERMEVKDLLSYLRLCMNPNDDAALQRIINVPTRGIGKTTIQKISDLAMKENTSIWIALQIALDNGLFNNATLKKLRPFVELIDGFRKLAETAKLSDLYIDILEQSGYEEKLKLDDSPEAHARLENLQELLNAIKQFEKERGEKEALLESFLEEMALVSEADKVEEDANCVHLMTLHISKGLEFPYVFIVGLEEGVFPSVLRMDSDEEEELEEERRLAYVGITRAQKQICLCYAKKRRVWGSLQMNSPSRFLKEIPEKYKIFSSALGTIDPAKSSFQSRIQKNKQQNDFDENVDYIPDYDEGGLEESPYLQGMRVRHPTFGVGKVHQIQGSGENARIQIVFHSNQLKTFVAKYARLEKV